MGTNPVTLAKENRASLDRLSDWMSFDARMSRLAAGQF